MTAGLVIYCVDIARLSAFYQQLLSLELIEQESDYALLQSEGFELVLLATQVSKALSDEPITPREQVALKPVLFIEAELAALQQQIAALGGRLNQPKSWQFAGRKVVDGSDPEGNIFQLRLARPATA